MSTTYNTNDDRNCLDINDVIELLGSQKECLAAKWFSQNSLDTARRKVHKPLGYSPVFSFTESAQNRIILNIFKSSLRKAVKKLKV